MRKNMTGGTGVEPAVCAIFYKGVLEWSQHLGPQQGSEKLSKKSDGKGVRKMTGRSITFVFVTHDQEEAMAMADRIVIMDKGLIEQVGTPTEIYFQPKTRMVAGFIGNPSMNFMKGEISKNFTKS